MRQIERFGAKHFLIKLKRMTTEKELNEAILKITLTIQSEFPELSKYIEEMPVTIPTAHPDIKLKNLADYYDSLNNVMKKYAKSH